MLKIKGANGPKEKVNQSENKLGRMKFRANGSESLTKLCIGQMICEDEPIKLAVL